MSSEDAELEARISALRGQIDQQKNGRAAHTSVLRGAQHPPFRGRGRGRGAIAKPAPRGRGAPLFRNRVLVLNGAGDPSPDASDASGTSTPNNGAWIHKNDRHMQLINPVVYQRNVQQRMAAIEDARKQKLKLRDEKEKSKMNRMLQLLAGTYGNTTSGCELEIQGIKFRMMLDGSKLIRVIGDGTSKKTTPRSVLVGKVPFFRSKNGNLYRGGAIKAQRQSHGIKKIDKPCKLFSNTGSCPKGPKCPYIHDAGKVAICNTFLKTKDCPNGDACDMSHELTAERVPHCHHFQKGVCTKEDCPYVHVRVSPTALVCQNFPVYGYCEKGVNCTEKHIIECPDFSNTGSCTDRRCKLPHKYKAHHLRNNADSKQEDSDISSDEDEDPIDSDEVDSDDMEEYFASADGPEDMDFAEQKDFIEM